MGITQHILSPATAPDEIFDAIDSDVVANAHAVMAELCTLKLTMLRFASLANAANSGACDGWPSQTPTLW